jgi:flavin reductase (DIM6/NTAB) family NADH-FMN oxidoreductase RutF
MLQAEAASSTCCQRAGGPLARFASKRVSFDGVGYQVDDRGFILLDGVVATIACEPHNRFEAGDHTVFIGRVIGGSAAPGRPLLYYRGGYMTPGRA